MSYRFTALVWLYPGDGGWHFVTLPAAVADEVRATAGPRRGFGSVRVTVTIGQTTWQTSIFPDRESGSFVLPIRKQTRAAEDIEADDEVAVTLELAGPDAAPRRTR